MSKIQLAMIEAANAINSGIIDVRTKKLCHYTTPKGLLGIFGQEEPALYFSQYDSLNDAKERKDIFEILQKFCDKRLRERKCLKNCTTISYLFHHQIYLVLHTRQMRR